MTGIAACVWHRPRWRWLAGALFAAVIAGCAVAPPSELITEPPGTEPEVPATPESVLGPSPVSESSAVIALVDVARLDVEAARFANAVAALERALRIEPRNPRLWQELARLRLKQGDFEQAENLAVRSNSWAGSDNSLRAENWRLIAETRSRRGDEAGARAAIERAERLTP